MDNRDRFDRIDRLERFERGVTLEPREGGREKDFNTSRFDQDGPIQRNQYPTPPQRQDDDRNRDRERDNRGDWNKHGQSDNRGNQGNNNNNSNNNSSSNNYSQERGPQDRAQERQEDESPWVRAPKPVEQEPVPEKKDPTQVAMRPQRARDLNNVLLPASPAYSQSGTILCSSIASLIDYVDESVSR